MPLIPFPAIPPFPGVPSLPSLPGGELFPQGETVLTADDPSINSAVSEPQWGIFGDDGSPVASADSVISFEHMKEYRICEYPVEPGSTDNTSGQSSAASSFASYNKVEMPYDVRITFSKGGDDSARAQFLGQIDTACGDLNLYTVNTPDATYVNANIVRYDYTRTAKSGVTLLLVEVFIRQVRTTGQSQLSENNTVDPGSSDQVHDGTVYPLGTTSPDDAAMALGVT